MKTFGRKVREARKALGYTQGELGEKMGISGRMVAAYETGGRKPRNANLEKLAEVLGCTVDYLLNDDITDENTEISEEFEIQGVQGAERIGSKSKAEAEMEFIKQRGCALFAGGELSQQSKDEFFNALYDAYLECKNVSDD